MKRKAAVLAQRSPNRATLESTRISCAALFGSQTPSRLSLTPELPRSPSGAHVRALSRLAIVRPSERYGISGIR